MVKEDYYFGNPDQIRGVEECYLLEGKADGVRIMRVRNGLGLEVTVCPDRCADITRVISAQRSGQTVTSSPSPFRTRMIRTPSAFPSKR